MRASNGQWRAVAALSIVLSCPAISGGQTATTNAAIAPPDLKTWDFSAGVGWFGRRMDSGNAYTFHDESLWTGITFGRYWTENLKTEVDLASAGTSRGYITQTYSDSSLPPSAYPDYVYANQNVSGLQVALVGAYQFFHNAWFHPSVAAGLVVERERTTIDRPFQELYYRPDTPGSTPRQIQIAAESTSRTEWNLRPVAQVGFKLYVSDHAFFRSDLRLTVGTGVSTTGRVGFGIDF